MKHVVCLGHAKCGTTLLDQVFRGSRRVSTPKDGKELKFFLPSQFPVENPYCKYLERFGAAEGRSEFLATFEASPQYCHQPYSKFGDVLDNIAHTLIDPKLVICFRQPVVRAYSHYIHNLHTFGLYGEGVFSPRPELPRKICNRSFEQALLETTRLRTNYSKVISRLYSRFGAQRVAMFFLENDASTMNTWVESNLGSEIASGMNAEPDRNTPVFGRRPVPNYITEGADLVAFGSISGEYVRYENLDSSLKRKILASRSSWTLSLTSREILDLTRRYFREDLRECVELTGDARFEEYLESTSEPEFSQLTDYSMYKDEGTPAPP